MPFPNLLFNSVNQEKRKISESIGGSEINIPNLETSSPTSNKQDSEDFKINLKIVENLLSILVSTFLSSLAYGIVMVMVALRLEANVKNEILISLSTITQIGAGVIFSRFLPNLGQKTGLVKTIIYGSFIAAASVLMLYRYYGFLPWLIVIYFMGTSLFTLGVSRHTLMINLTPSHLRSLIISISTSIVALGNALGPIILNVIKTNDEFVILAIASCLYICSTFPLFHLSKIDSKIKQQKKIGVWRYIKNSPKIMFGGFCSSYAMSSCSAFAIIYGLHIQMSKEDASLLLSSFLFGAIFYVPLGYIGNHINRRFIMIISAILAIICVQKIYLNQNHENIFLMFFLLFGSISGIKLTSTVLINEKYKSTQRLAVNSAYTRITLLGTISGLLVTGAMMKNFGNSGLWISNTLILALFLVFCFANYVHKFLKKDLVISEISIFIKKSQPQESSNE